MDLFTSRCGCGAIFKPAVRTQRVCQTCTMRNTSQLRLSTPASGCKEELAKVKYQNRQDLTWAELKVKAAAAGLSLTETYLREHGLEPKPKAKPYEYTVADLRSEPPQYTKGLDENGRAIRVLFKPALKTAPVTDLGLQLRGYDSLRGPNRQAFDDEVYGAQGTLERIISEVVRRVTEATRGEPVTPAHTQACAEMALELFSQALPPYTEVHIRPSHSERTWRQSEPVRRKLQLDGVIKAMYGQPTHFYMVIGSDGPNCGPVLGERRF